MQRRHDHTDDERSSGCCKISGLDPVMCEELTKKSEIVVDLAKFQMCIFNAKMYSLDCKMDDLSHKMSIFKPEMSKVGP